MKLVLRKALSATMSKVVEAPPVLHPPKPTGKAPEYDWNAMFEMFMSQDVNRAEDDRRQGVFHPSSGLTEESENCPRQVILDLLCAPRSAKRIAAKMAKIFDNGHNRHAGIYKVFHRMAEMPSTGIYSVQDEVALEHAVLPIAGHADLIITMRNGHRYLLDVKTINAANFNKLMRPDYKHLSQINTYLGMAGIDTGYFLYENKDTQAWAVPMNRFRVDFDAKLWKQTESHCRGLLEKAVMHRLPEFDEATCDANINFCGYRDSCEKQRNKLVSTASLDRRPMDVRSRHKEALSGA